jgi:F-type H+-transporting ATPase subunit delta
LKERLVASRYARSLIELAIEEGKVDRLFVDMAILQEIAAGVPHLTEALADERVPLSKRIKVAKKIISDLKLMKITGNTIRLLIEKGRIAILPYVAQSILKNLRLRKSMKVAHAQVADRAFAEDLRVRLEKILSDASGMTIECEVDVDPTLIGGFVVEVGDRRFDSSIKGKLTRMKEDFFSEAKGF